MKIHEKDLSQTQPEVAFSPQAVAQLAISQIETAEKKIQSSRDVANILASMTEQLIINCKSDLTLDIQSLNGVLTTIYSNLDDALDDLDNLRDSFSKVQ
jgi:uncharacterized phage infection (PIP) family protein YhgE